LDSSSETFDVHNLVRAWRSGHALKAARDAADTLFEAFRAGVAANQTLHGAVSTCRVAASHMTSAQTTDGCSVSIEFVIQCRVF
jgi:hypothetical protein